MAVSSTDQINEQQSNLSMMAWRVHEFGRVWRSCLHNGNGHGWGSEAKARYGCRTGGDRASDD
jgi:hypothetical protein